MNRWSRLVCWFRNFIEAKEWDQYAIESLAAIYTDENDMTYRLARRTRDADTGIVHIKDVVSGTFSYCGQGFAASTIATTVKHTTVPTCVFCIAGMRAWLPQWRFLAPDTVYRRTIEEGLRDRGD